MPLSRPLTCVIIDDNEFNRLTLEHLVGMNESLTLLASLSDGIAALRFLPQPTPAIIIVTSHRDFAVEAFDLRVVDYLIKPVNFARFHQAITRAIAQRQDKPARPEATTVLPAPDSPDQTLFVKVNNRMVRLDFDEVLFIEALSTYSVLVTATQKHIVYATLKSLEERVPFGHFQRVHRSYIVNTRRIEVIEDNMLQIGPYEVPVGKSYLEAFNRSLRNL
jgi:two-component system LytT family response regulator